MEKMVLVHYIDIRGLEPDKVGEYIQEIIKTAKPNDNDIISYFIPVLKETTIECLNPKLASEQEYIVVNEFLEKNQKLINDTIESIKK